MQVRAQAVILAIFAALSGATLAFSQAPATTPSPAVTPAASATPAASPAKPQPKAVLVDPVHDFGIQPAGDKLVWEFTVRNDGQAPLLISDVRPSCACTVASFDKTIAPGATGRVRVELDTQGMSGSMSKQLVVMTNDPTNPSLTLTLQATLRPHFAASPDYLRFIAVEQDAAQTQSSTIASPDFADLQLGRIDSPYPFLKVTSREARADERIIGLPGRQWRIEATLNPDGPVGPLAKAIVIETNHPQQKNFELPVTGFLRPVIAVTPPVADLGKVSLREPYRKNVKVQNFSAEPVNFDRAECTVPGVTVELQPTRPGHVYLVWVSLSPKMHKGDFAGQISLFSNNPKHPRLDIALRGTIE
ncbi:MAG: DUF1573 domain-containing protein [Acidobacteriota bacterium]